MAQQRNLVMGNGRHYSKATGWIGTYTFSDIETAWLAMMGHIVIPEDGHIDQVGKAREVEKSGPAKKSCYG